ncbi:hypothetical protein JCM10207_006257 [Rhodosporidiobolus poonsookiae]
MARSSTRGAALKAKRAFAEAAEDDDGDEFNPCSSPAPADEGDYTRAPKKKARRSSTGGGGGGAKGTKGSLSGILSLPLETLTLVCSHLDLATVFHLSRLNKQFYGFLRDPALKYIWKGARERSGLPELKAGDFSVYDFANLLFGNCSGCGKLTPKVDYMLRLRSCKTCSEDLITDNNDELYSYWASSVAPYSDHQGVKSRSTVKYLVQDLNRIRYVENRYDERTAEVLRFDGLAIIEWQQEQLEKEEEVREGVRVRRREEIERRLVELGWHAHHFEDDKFKQHTLVCAAKEFDPRSWSKMQPVLEAVLRENEAANDAQHLQSEIDRRSQLLEDELSELFDDVPACKSAGIYPLPKWDELRDLPSVKPLWDLPAVEDTYGPDGTLLGIKDALHDDLEQIKDAFQQSIFPRLLAVLQEIDALHASAAAASTASPSSAVPSLAPPPADGISHSADEQKTILSQAAALVRCSSCDFADTFPRILGHRCRGSNWSLQGLPSFSPSLDQYKCSVKLSEIVVRLAGLAGEDATVTATEMDKLGSGFTCLDHEASDAYVAVPWVAMVHHLYSPWKHVTRSAKDAEVIFEDRQSALERVFEKHEKEHSKIGSAKRGELV